MSGIRGAQPPELMQNPERSFAYESWANRRVLEPVNTDYITFVRDPAGQPWKP